MLICTAFSPRLVLPGVVGAAATATSTRTAGPSSAASAAADRRDGRDGRGARYERRRRGQLAAGQLELREVGRLDADQAVLGRGRHLEVAARDAVGAPLAVDRVDPLDDDL